MSVWGPFTKNSENFCGSWIDIFLILDLRLIEQVISREAREYELGETKYYLVVVWSAIVWQCFYLGAIGVIFYSSSLLSAIIIHVLFPLTQTLAIVFYHESFHAEKGVAFFLVIWGFTSYFWGEIRYNKNNKNIPTTVDNQTHHLET